MTAHAEKRVFRLIAALVAGSILLAVPVVRSLREPASTLWTIPRTPADHSPGSASIWWHFLDQARTHLPSGASYTIRAQDRNIEMRLLMIAIGLLPDHEIRPSSYFGKPTRNNGGDDAEYVLFFGTAPPDHGLEQVAVVDDGAVYRRGRVLQ